LLMAENVWRILLGFVFLYSVREPNGLKGFLLEISLCYSL
jgi:hypothetical protein